MTFRMMQPACAWCRCHPCVCKRAMPCACGGHIETNLLEPVVALRLHQAEPRHQAWRERNEL